jgi:signal transduction histidine kinase/ActR/RegA family two-component response regulator
VAPTSWSAVVDRSEQIAVWAPRGRDRALAVQLIARHGLSAATLDDVDELIAAIPEIGCAVITAEVLTVPIRDRLAEALAAQPPWSDLPILLFAPRGLHRTDETLAAVSALGNVSILERPVNGGEFISALRAALRGRRRQYEARDAIRRRDQFLAMLGHELRNPLGAILLAIEAVPADARAGPGERQRAIIERQARHLARLVDDLLDVARVTSGKVRLQAETLDLSAVAERCIHGAELAASSRSIELRAELWPQPLYVDGDLVRLEEIFNNLISNAIKYSPEGARVTVRTRRDGAACVVEVADTGIGIAPDMLDRVFDLFAQADGSLDRSQGGLGIGLTLVRSLVQLHGGTVTASSAGLGHGSRFVVELPGSRSAPRTVSAPRLVAVEAPRPRRILLVEDNIDLLDLTTDLFVTFGYEVATATDGAAGLASLHDAPPDVAFIDIGIPLLDGYDVARQARAAGVTSYLVAMTGYGQPEDQRRAHEAGFDRHITKPVGVATLRDVLAAAEANRPPPAVTAAADARRRPS